MNFYKQIKYEELTPDFQFLADACGLETAQLVLEKFGGLSFYVPKISSHKDFIVRLYLETNPKSLKEFCKKINVSETYMRSIIK